MTGTERRSEILDQVRQCVCRDRQATHGDAERNFHHIAHLWKWWLSARHHVDVPVDELDVAEMMVLFKSSRKAASPLHLDNWIDGAGYAVCGGGIVKAKEDSAPKAQVASATQERRCDVTSLGNPPVQCWANAGHSGPHLFIREMSDTKPDPAANAQETWKNFSDEAWRKFDKTLEKFQEHPDSRCTETMLGDTARRCTMRSGHSGAHVFDQTTYGSCSKCGHQLVSVNTSITCPNPACP